VGGLADVAAALPAAVADLGHDVKTFTPLYAAIDRRQAGLLELPKARSIPVELGHTTFRFSLLAAPPRSAHGELYFVDCPALYGRREIYTTDADEPRRFALLCRAVFESCRALRWRPQVLHCNDWHAALVPLLRRTLYARDPLFASAATMLTIHNLGYQGVCGAETIDSLGLGDWRGWLDREDLDAGRINFLKTGLMHADVVGTVSPTYAREIQRDEHGMGLARLLRSRGDALLGILNGVDYEEWSPERDAWIPHRYSVRRLAVKKRNRADLLKRLALSGVGNEPVIGIISRLVAQKGFDLCYSLLPALLAGRRIGLVALGEGEREYEEFFESMQRRFPERAAFHRGHHVELAHRIEAGTDLFLMPSRYEPCGLNQLFSLRYGTIPVVRRTGGLADSVESYDPNSGSGTGFVFDGFTTQALDRALGQALDTYADTSRWHGLMRNAMSRDFSWKARAADYAQAYARLVRD
jgi:starch synthase